jgi:hypothetical protein
VNLVIKIFNLCFRDTYNLEKGYEIFVYIHKLRQQCFNQFLIKAGEQTNSLKQKNLKVLYNLQKFEIYLSEYLMLEKMNVGLYLEVCEDFREMAFNKENLNVLKNAYMMSPDYNLIEIDNFRLAELLIQAIRFHKKVLDNPHIWDDIDLGHSSKATEETI